MFAQPSPDELTKQIMSISISQRNEIASELVAAVAMKMYSVDQFIGRCTLVWRMTRNSYAI